MDLDLDAKNILEMKMIKTCIKDSSYTSEMKKQLIDFIEGIVDSLNKDNKIEVNIVLEETIETSSEDERWED